MNQTGQNYLLHSEHFVKSKSKIRGLTKKKQTNKPKQSKNKINLKKGQKKKERKIRMRRRVKPAVQRSSLFGQPDVYVAWPALCVAIVAWHFPVLLSNLFHAESSSEVMKPD